jgi:hypothetical protein
MKITVLIASVLFVIPASAQKIIWESWQARINHCLQSPRGEIIVAELNISDHPELKPKVQSMDMNKFCPCLYQNLQKEMGPELAERDRKSELQGMDFVQVAEIKKKVYPECVSQAIGVQVQKPTTAMEAGKTSMVVPKNERFEKVFNSLFESGKGLGGVDIGMKMDDVIKVLGTTSAINWGATKQFKVYYYGPGLTELTIMTKLKDTERVVKVAVSSRYRGATDHGARMGDSFEKVKSLYSNPVVEYKDTRLLYKDGTLFQFDHFDKKLKFIAVVTADSDPSDAKELGSK